MHWVYILFVLLCVSHSAFCIAIYLQPPLLPVDEIEHDNTPPITLGDLMGTERDLQREIQRRALYSGRWFHVQRRVRHIFSMFPSGTYCTFSPDWAIV